MRPRDETPLDPEIAATLDALDATLDGEPVDPRFAELAELALLTVAERPRPRPEFTAELDARVRRRFAPADAPPRGSAPRRSRRWPRPRLSLATGGYATALVAAIVAVVVLSSGSGPHAQQGRVNGPSSDVTTSASSVAAAPASKSASSATASGSSGSAGHSAEKSAASPPTTAAATTPAPQSLTSAASQAVTPQANGRKAIQSAQLALTSKASRIDDVAQEAFDVIGDENGIVNHSSVTAGSGGGYAQLQVSVPSANLADTMTRLSELRYADVASRTDNSQDVNDRAVSDARRLADARALRTSLLKQLASAVTQEQIDSLKAQLHDVETTITNDQNAVDSLNKQVNLSQIELTINPGNGPTPVAPHSSGGFTLHRAAHDAKRVLVVVAGVALITLAALAPIALLVALGLWGRFALRRRSREQALDAH